MDKHINRVQESFANTNYFAYPPMIPCTKKRDNNDVVMMPSTVPNSPVFIPPPIAKTQDLSSSSSSQPRTMVKEELSTPQQSDDLQFKVDLSATDGYLLSWYYARIEISFKRWYKRIYGTIQTKRSTL